MLVRCVQPTAVQRAYPFLRTERTHGLSSRICKHQFSDWTSFQVKGRFFTDTHTVWVKCLAAAATNCGCRAAAVVVCRFISVLSR